jgi:hypothetical protein
VNGDGQAIDGVAPVIAIAIIACSVTFGFVTRTVVL